MIPENLRLLRIEEVCKVLDVSRSQIYRLMDRHGFPRPVALSSKGRRWRSDELEHWIQERSEARGEAEPH